MAENKSEKQTKPQCDHDWKAVGESHMKTHVKLVCTKCGQEKEIEQFQF